MSEVPESIKRAILGRIFPELLHDSDPDIERYYDLRRQGRHQDALALYTARLCRKYPREDRRFLVLKYYRQNDPRYRVLLRQSAMELADAVVARVKGNVDRLVEPMRGVRRDDTMRLLQAVERIVRMLPEDKYGAVEIVGNYLKYAEILGYRHDETRDVENLVREYLFEAQAESDAADTDFMRRAERLEETKRRDAAEKSRYFDVSKVRFSAEDLDRITLPPSITRKEDLVLGYCYKYWNNVNDPSFERTVFLYSKKFGTNHHSVYRALKIARAKKFTDDEILNMLSTVVSNRYSYSVQGDYYMQAAWRRLKANLSAKPGPAKAAESGARREPTAPAEQTAQVHAGSRVSPNAEPRKPDVSVPKVEREPVAPARPASIVSEPVKARGTRTKESVRQSVAARSAEASVAPAIPAAAVPERQRKESVSEKIRRLSGTTYDIYRNMFLEHVRFSIHSYLVSHKTGSRSLFDTSANQAEDAVFAFIRDNYDNPYMDWEGSPERAKVAELRFSVDSLDPVIEDCFDRIRKAG